MCRSSDAGKYLTKLIKKVNVISMHGINIGRKSDYDRVILECHKGWTGKSDE